MNTRPWVRLSRVSLSILGSEKVLVLRVKGRGRSRGSSIPKVKDGERLGPQTQRSERGRILRTLDHGLSGVLKRV